MYLIKDCYLKDINSKITTQFKKWAKGLNRKPHQKRYTDGKDAPYPMSSGKCKLK